MKRAGALGLALALIASACAGGGEGSRPAPGQPPRIVSLNPCTDAILAKVADRDQLLAISHYSKDPAASSMAAADAARYQATGGDVEEILALAPDVVVASVFLDPATRNALEDLGVRVQTYGMATSIAESEAQVRALAGLAGHPARGEALVADMRAALAAARPAPGAPAVETAVWQPGGIVPGETALVSELLRHTGLASYTRRRGMAQGDYLSLEQVLADPPDLLLVAGSEAGQHHPALRHLPRMRRETLDIRLLYCGGPTVIRAAERLAEVRDPAGSGR